MSPTKRCPSPPNTSRTSLSIAVNVFLLTLKIVVGVLTGSVALWASAADSLLDLSASSFAYVGVRIGSRPPDDTHAYGHDKFESLSSLIQLGLLFVTVGVTCTARSWSWGNCSTWGGLK